MTTIEVRAAIPCIMPGAVLVQIGHHSMEYTDTLENLSPVDGTVQAEYHYPYGLDNQGFYCGSGG